MEPTGTRQDRGEPAYHDVLPGGYDAEDAVADRRDLETLEDPRVPWRTKRRLRHRVGDEAELAARLVAWEALRPTTPPAPHDAVRVLQADAVALAREYHQVCSELWGHDDPDVIANARRIAAGDVLPWEARRAITVERERAARRRGAGEV